MMRTSSDQYFLTPFTTRFDPLKCQSRVSYSMALAGGKHALGPTRTPLQPPPIEELQADMTCGSRATTRSDHIPARTASARHLCRRSWRLCISPRRRWSDTIRRTALHRNQKESVRSNLRYHSYDESLFLTNMQAFRASSSRSAVPRRSLYTLMSRAISPPCIRKGSITTGP